jgi:hypothetical protein
MTSQTVQEGANSDATNASLNVFFKTALKQAQEGRFDIAALGEAFEGTGSDLPLVGQYVEARRWLFGEADKLGIGRAVRVFYHSTETGARVSAALAAEATVLAASNYGAAGASTLAAASALGAAAGPIGVGVGVVVGVLSALFGGDPQDPAERAAALVQARTNAKKALAALAQWPASTRAVFAQTTAYRMLVTMSNYANDPLAFIADPTIREQLRLAVYKQSGVVLSDSALVDETRKRLEASKGSTTHLIDIAHAYTVNRDGHALILAAAKKNALANRLGALSKTTKGLQLTPQALLPKPKPAPVPTVAPAPKPAAKAPTMGITGSDILKAGLAVGVLYALKSAL